MGLFDILAPTKSGPTVSDSLAGFGGNPMTDMQAQKMYDDPNTPPDVKLVAAQILDKARLRGEKFLGVTGSQWDGLKGLAGIGSTIYGMYNDYQENKMQKKAFNMHEQDRAAEYKANVNMNNAINSNKGNGNGFGVSFAPTLT